MSEHALSGQDPDDVVKPPSIITPRVIRVERRRFDLGFISDEEQRGLTREALGLTPKSVRRPKRTPSKPIRRALLGFGGVPVDGAAALFEGLAGKSENTETTYATAVRMWVEECQLAGVDPLYMDFDVLQEYRDEVRIEDHGVAPGTWNQGLHALRRFNDAAIRAGYLAQTLMEDSDWRDLKLDERRIFWPRVVEPEDYRSFRSAGLSGMSLRGRMTPTAYGMRTAVRDRLYADFLIAHGLRRAEASHFTLLDLPRRRATKRLNDMFVPANIAKWGSSRVVPEERAWAEKLAAYHDSEWFSTVETMQKVLRRKSDLLVVEHVDGRFEPRDTRLHVRGEHRRKSLAKLRKQERMRLVCTAEVARFIAREEGMGEALGAVGDGWLVPLAVFPGTRSPMVGPEAWSLTFRQANQRLEAALLEAGVPPRSRVTPHMLRHTYAVNTLTDLMNTISEEDREYLATLAEARNTDTAVLKRRYLNPLLTVQRRLGHRSLTTTIIYLQYAAAEAEAGLPYGDSWIENFLAAGQ